MRWWEIFGAVVIWLMVAVGCVGGGPFSPRTTLGNPVRYRCSPCRSRVGSLRLTRLVSRMMGRVRTVGAVGGSDAADAPGAEAVAHRVVVCGVWAAVACAGCAGVGSAAGVVGPCRWDEPVDA
jgi:hypothetical protein